MPANERTVRGVAAARRTRRAYARIGRTSQPDAVTDIISCCAGLPLALAITAAAVRFFEEAGDQAASANLYLNLSATAERRGDLVGPLRLAERLPGPSFVCCLHPGGAGRP